MTPSALVTLQMLLRGRAPQGRCARPQRPRCHSIRRRRALLHPNNSTIPRQLRRSQLAAALATAAAPTSANRSKSSPPASRMTTFPVPAMVVPNYPRQPPPIRRPPPPASHLSPPLLSCSCRGSGGSRAGAFRRHPTPPSSAPVRAFGQVAVRRRGASRGRTPAPTPPPPLAHRRLPTP